MRYAGIFHTSSGQTVNAPFSGPRARGDFDRRCFEAGAKWGYLYNEATGELMHTHQPRDAAARVTSAVAARLAQDPPVKATQVMATLAKLVGEHGDHDVLFAIPDEGAFNVSLPRFDTDGTDGCFIL